MKNKNCVVLRYTPYSGSKPVEVSFEDTGGMDICVIIEGFILALEETQEKVDGKLNGELEAYYYIYPSVSLDHIKLDIKVTKKGVEMTSLDHS